MQRRLSQPGRLAQRGLLATSCTADYRREQQLISGRSLPHRVTPECRRCCSPTIPKGQAGALGLQPVAIVVRLNCRRARRMLVNAVLPESPRAGTGEVLSK
jgi:hypothetical protein